MRAKVQAVFLGIQENEFTDRKSGEVVKFKRATFNVRNSPETFQLGVPKDLDHSLLAPYADAFILVDFRYNEAARNFTGRVANVYSDLKSMESAPLLSQKESMEL